MLRRLAGWLVNRQPKAIPARPARDIPHHRAGGHLKALGVKARDRYLRLPPRSRPRLA
jgi:hypothetical protein